MILWFAGMSVVIVWQVFRSPALDYRLVMLGAVLPVGEIVFGGPRLLHTLLFAVVLLTVVMLATQRQTPCAAPADRPSHRHPHASGARWRVGSG